MIIKIMDHKYQNLFCFTSSLYLSISKVHSLIVAYLWLFTIYSNFDESIGTTYRYLSLSSFSYFFNRQFYCRSPYIYAEFDSIADAAKLMYFKYNSLYFVYQFLHSVMHLSNWIFGTVSKLRRPGPPGTTLWPMFYGLIGTGYDTCLWAF